MIASLQFLPIAMYQFLTILMTSITMTMLKTYFMTWPKSPKWEGLRMGTVHCWGQSLLPESPQRCCSGFQDVKKILRWCFFHKMVSHFQVSNFWEHKTRMSGMLIIDEWCFLHNFRVSNFLNYHWGGGLETKNLHFWGSSFWTIPPLWGRNPFILPNQHWVQIVSTFVYHLKKVYRYRKGPQFVKLVNITIRMVCES